MDGYRLQSISTIKSGSSIVIHVNKITSYIRYGHQTWQGPTVVIIWVSNELRLKKAYVLNVHQWDFSG